MEQPNLNPYVVDTMESGNPSVYNDEAPSNPSSQYTINLDFLAGEGENEWYKVKR